MQQIMMTNSAESLRTSEDYIPRDDASEAARLTSLGGFGQVLYEQDEESLAQDLAGLGLYVNPNSQ